VAELLLATTNAGKLAEVEAFVKRLSINLISLRALGAWPQVVEDGSTYEENALKKARTLAQYSGVLTLADDSGLEVDALNGEPGVHSARYSGKDATDQSNNAKLLAELSNIPEAQRRARFVCVLALCAPSPAGIQEWTVRAECEGRITFAPRGENGFGYDPLFFYPPLGKTFGEIDRETKASVSHRGKALKRMTEILAVCARVKP
jgi:XTP/dITP diphosphohydrolase